VVKKVYSILLALSWVTDRISAIRHHIMQSVISRTICRPNWMTNFALASSSPASHPTTLRSSYEWCNGMDQLIRSPERILRPQGVKCWDYLVSGNWDWKWTEKSKNGFHTFCISASQSQSLTLPLQTPSETTENWSWTYILLILTESNDHNLPLHNLNRLHNLRLQY